MHVSLHSRKSEFHVYLKYVVFSSTIGHETLLIFFIFYFPSSNFQSSMNTTQS